MEELEEQKREVEGGGQGREEGDGRMRGVLLSFCFCSEDEHKRHNVRFYGKHMYCTTISPWHD